MKTLARLFKEESGQDLTEYVLLMVLIALAAVASVNTLANTVENVFFSAASNLVKAMTPAPPTN